MLVDIIYDDNDYYWNKDYKKIFTDDYPEYLADKHKKPSYETFKNKKMLDKATESM